MRIEREVDIDIDIDDILAELDEEGKEILYNELGSELSKDGQMQKINRDKTIGYLENISYYDLKKILCLLLNVPSYHDEKTLRERLEPIITAK